MELQSVQGKSVMLNLTAAGRQLLTNLCLEAIHTRTNLFTLGIIHSLYQSDARLVAAMYRFQPLAK